MATIRTLLVLAAAALVHCSSSCANESDESTTSSSVATPTNADESDASLLGHTRVTRPGRFRIEHLAIPRASASAAPSAAPSST
ncbi:MAG TPA: hypothetical protein VGH28_26005 [Polyangiaceae bacterium]|jgi:hypothetical protein